MKKHDLYVAAYTYNLKFREQIHNQLCNFKLKDPVYDFYKAKGVPESQIKWDKIPLEPDYIIRCDKKDLLECANFVAFIDRYSAGTCMEILYAFEHQIPVYIIDPSFSYRKDIWIFAHTNEFFNSIDNFVGFFKYKMTGENNEKFNNKEV